MTTKLPLDPLILPGEPLTAEQIALSGLDFKTRNAIKSVVQSSQVLVQYADVAALNAAIAANPGWLTDQEIRVLSEPAGFTRIWNGSNALTVALPNGNTITLAASSNTILSTSGTPSGGNNGDYSYNKTTSILYLKANGVWQSRMVLYPKINALPSTNFPLVSAPNWINKFSGAATAIGGTAAWYSSTPDTKQLYGSAVCSFSVPAGGSGNVTADWNLSPAVDLSSVYTITIYVYLDTPTDGALGTDFGVDFTLYLGSDTGFSNNYSINVSALKDGLNTLTIPLSSFSTTGSPNWNSIVRMRLRVGQHATIARYMTFVGISYGGKIKPTIVFTADDGRPSQYSILYPALKAAGLRATFFVIPQFVDDDTNDAFTSAQAREMLADGFEFAIHDNAAYYNYTERQLLDRLRTVKNQIYKKIGQCVPVCAYPQGYYSAASLTDTSVAEIRRSLVTAGIKGGFVASTDQKSGIIDVSDKTVNPYTLNRKGFDTANQLASVQTQYNLCKNTGGVLVIMLHSIGTGYGATQADITDVQTFISAVGADVANGTVQCITAGELVDWLTI